MKKPFRRKYSARFRVSPAIRVVSRDFEDVLAFLERFQVGPKLNEAALQPNLRERLERFADGLCTGEERDEIVEILKGDPSLVGWVADRVKERRRNE